MPQDLGADLPVPGQQDVVLEVVDRVGVGGTQQDVQSRG